MRRTAPQHPPTAAEGRTSTDSDPSPRRELPTLTRGRCRYLLQIETLSPQETIRLNL